MVETSKQTDVRRPQVHRDDIARKTGSGPAEKVQQVADRAAQKAAKHEQEYDRVHSEFTK